MVPTSSRPLQKYLQLPRTIVNLTRLVNFPDLFHPTNSLHFASSYICLIHTNTLPNNFSQSIHLRLGLPRNLMPGNSLYYNLFTTFASFLMTIPLKFTLFYTHSGSFTPHKFRTTSFFTRSFVLIPQARLQKFNATALILDLLYSNYYNNG